MFDSEDLLKPIGNCEYLPLINQITDNCASELVGYWRVIIRRNSTCGWHFSDNLSKSLSVFDLVSIMANGTIDFPDLQEVKLYTDIIEKYGKKKWRVVKKHEEYFICADLDPYSSSSILYRYCRDKILFNDGDVVVTRYYILIREEIISKYNTLPNLLGYITSLVIKSFFLMQLKRRELLKECKGSMNKANDYMRTHSDEITYSLMPRFDTFRYKFFHWLDIFKKDNPKQDDTEIELPIEDNYTPSWRVQTRRNFSKEELSQVKSAKVVYTQYADEVDGGKSVCFTFNSGRSTSIPLSSSSMLKEGDLVDLKKANIIMLSKDREVDRIEIEA